MDGVGDRFPEAPRLIRKLRFNGWNGLWHGEERVQVDEELLVILMQVILSVRHCQGSMCVQAYRFVKSLLAQGIVDLVCPYTVNARKNILVRNIFYPRNLVLFWVIAEYYAFYFALSLA